MVAIARVAGLVLSLSTAGAHAQTPWSTDPFAPAELLSGKQMSQSDCAALPGAVWAAGECIRYYHSDAGGRGRDVVVFLSADPVTVNGRGETKASAGYVKSSPAVLAASAANLSRMVKMPYLFLARPGTYGSSGRIAQRRSAREIDVLAAALDAIKVKIGASRLHLIGYGEGGHAAALLMERRGDLGCVVLASALLAVRHRLAETGRPADVAGPATLDPVASVARIVRGDGLRILVLTDPDDVVISARSQTAYVRRLQEAGLPVTQLFPAALDLYSHQLSRQGLQVAGACARGASDATIAAAFDKKRPAEPPDAPDPPLHALDTIRRGVAFTEEACRGPHRLSAKVDGRPFCIRYFLSNAGGTTKDAALVFFDGDIGAVRNGAPVLNEAAARVTAGGIGRNARVWSRLYGGAYVVIGRIGTLGTSGHHVRDRRTLTEARVAAVALDRLKELHGFRRFHLVGQSGGGHTVATLAQTRTDVGCAVITSGVVAVKSFTRDRGAPANFMLRGKYDPIDFVDQMRHQPGRRLILLSDPQDKVVSFRSQSEFVARVRSQALPILHITASAGDKDFHSLAAAGHRVAIDCAGEARDDALVARYGRMPDAGADSGADSGAADGDSR